MTARVTVISADGLDLEAELDEADDPQASLVLCHPHPQMGGTMNAPLLLALRDEMVGRGWDVLRFNFRGIGASGGNASTGIAEVADARGAIELVRSRAPQRPVAVAGWSFGGAVAVRAATVDPGLVACVALAPAVEAKPGISDGLPPLSAADIAVPLLVVIGANDTVVSPEAVRAWAGGIQGARFETIPGANHFFWARYERLAGSVGDFLDERVTGGGSR